MFQYTKTVLKSQMEIIWKRVPEWLRGLLTTKGCLIQLNSVVFKNTVLFLCIQYTLVLIRHEYMT